MSAGTAAAFLALGLGLVAAAWRDPTAASSTVVALLGTLTVSLVAFRLVAVLGGRVLEAHVLSWPGMAIHTAVGLVVIAVALFALAYEKAPRPTGQAPSWMPLPIAVVGAALAVSLWHVLLTEQRARIAEDARHETHNLSEQLREVIWLRDQALVRLAGRWTGHGRMSEREWRQDATSYRDDFPGIVWLAYVDTHSIIRWIVPAKGNEHLVGSAARSLPSFDDAMKLAERGGIYPEQVYLERGDPGCLLSLPLVVAGRPDGHFQILISPKPFLELLTEDALQRGYSVSIQDGATRIFTQEQAGGPPTREWAQETLMAVWGRTWRLELWPGERRLRDLRTGAPQIALGFGLLISLLMAMVAYFWQRALAHARRRELEDAEVQKLITAKLKESEELAELIVESAPYGLLITDLDGTIVRVNRQLERDFRYEPGELAGQSEEILIPEHMRDGHVSARSRFLAAPAPRAMGAGRKTVGRRKDGSELPVDISLSPITTADRGMMLAVIKDITKQRQAEEELEAHHRLLETVFDSLPVWVSVRDRDGRYLLVNRAMAESIGKPRSELLGKTVSQIGLGSPEELARIGQLDREVIETGQGRDYPEVPLTMPDGVVHRFHTIRMPLVDGKGLMQGIVSASEDITNRLSLEAQFRQAQKMESIGQLAGGVAHDFNNMLAVILSYTEFLMEEFASNHRVWADLREVLEAGKRAAAVTRQLLAFSRRQILELRPIRLNEVVSGLEKFLGRLIGEDIRLDLVLRPTTSMVMADEGQLEQVVMNLAVNARDAMPEGGRLVIETSLVTLDEEYARQHAGVRPGEYALLTVSDSGVGMDEEVRTHIFEPFFTTKEKGKGTGLGLATVYGIVKQLGGNIWVYSEPGKGTTFKIYLPAAQSAGAMGKAAIEPAAVPGGTETILLVEDEAAVRQVARRILEGGGYRVVEASGAKEALALLSDRQRPIDLLLTDMVMPEMSGKDLADRSKTLAPETPVLYMSGYTENFIAYRPIPDQETSLVQKPFTRESLLRKVRETLDRGRSS